MAKTVTAKQFKKEMKRFSKRTLPKLVAASHALVTKAVYEKILERTPVLTGRARRNWNVSLNAPNPETTEEVAGVNVTGEPMTPAERKRANEVLRNLEQGRGGMGVTVFVSNHLPYIYFLEHGSSMKAPQGIVEGAIQAGLEAVESSTSKLDIDALGNL